MANRWIALLLVTTLAACGSSDQPSQAVARINDREISIHQFNHVVRLAGPAGTTEPVRRELAGKLVDRELAVQAALALKLDRQSDIMFRLEEARRDVLARAYAEHITADRTPPAQSDASRYFSEHPELFAKRKVFRLQEVVLPADAKELPTARQRLGTTRNFDEFLGWLKQADIPFSTQLSTRPAEELPIEVLPRLNETADGGTVIFDSSRGLFIYRVISAQSAPVTWEQVAPTILNHLARQDSRKALDAEMQRLRASAKMEYFGEFGQLLPGDAGAPKQAGARPAPG